MGDVGKGTLRERVAASCALAAKSGRLTLSSANAKALGLRRDSRLAGGAAPSETLIGPPPRRRGPSARITLVAARSGVDCLRPCAGGGGEVRRARAEALHVRSEDEVLPTPVVGDLVAVPHGSAAHSGRTHHPRLRGRDGEPHATRRTPTNICPWRGRSGQLIGPGHGLFPQRPVRDRERPRTGAFSLSQGAPGPRCRGGPPRPCAPHPRGT